MADKKVSQLAITTTPAGGYVHIITPDGGGGFDSFRILVDNLNTGLTDPIQLTPRTAPAHSEALVYYDQDKKALSYYNDEVDVTVNIAQEMIIRVQNNSGALIPNGSAVYFDGVASGLLSIALANAQEVTKSRLVHIATHDIENGTPGYVTRYGEVGDINTSSYSAGDILYLDTTDGQLTTTKVTDGAFSIQIGYVKTVNASSGVIFVDPTGSELAVEVTDTNGFPGDLISTIDLSFTDGTRTFTITPTGTDFHYYILGDKYEKTASENVVISNDEGLHVIYYDGATLTTQFNPTDGTIDTLIRTKALVAYVYWDAANAEHIYLGSELHGISMSPDTHSYLHFTRGAQYISGLGLNSIITDASGDLDVHAQFGTDAGQLQDEDLPTFLTQVLSTVGLPIYYLDGATGNLRKTAQAGFSVLTDVTAGVGATGRLVWNEFTGGAWQLSTVANNDFVLCHVFATNDDNKIPFSFIGQAEYTTLGNARAGANNEISNLLTTIPASEIIPIASVIFQTSNGSANAVQARVRSTGTGDDYVDWRATEVAQGASPTNHNNLAGLSLAQSGVTFGHIDDQAQTITGVKTFDDNTAFNGQAYNTGYTQTFAASTTFDMDNGNVQQMTLTSDLTTLDITNKQLGASYLIYLIQDGTGGHAIASPSANFGDVTDNSVPFIITADDVNIISVNVRPDGNTSYTVETISL